MIAIVASPVMLRTQEDRIQVRGLLTQFMWTGV